MKIRPLSANDMDFMISAREDFSDAWTEKMLISAFDSGSFYGFIAEDDNGAKPLPLGFIAYTLTVDTADLNDVYVVKAARHLGVGKALLSAFIKDADSRGAGKLFLEVRESNSAAINLYRAMGFKEISIRKKYYADSEDALVFCRSKENR